MTCYFRHLENVFKKAEIQVTPQNRSELDQAIHRIVGVKYKECPAVWKQVKKRLAENENSFVDELKITWKSQLKEKYSTQKKLRIQNQILK